MRYGKKLLVAVLVALVVTGAAVAAGTFHEVSPGKYDPGHTKLVQSQWLEGIGCPTNAHLSDGTSYTDPGCALNAPKDDANKGLLLVKTGPTTNNASAYAVLKDVPSTVNELGYDLRKPGVDQFDPRGSHCGGGAPRFNVTTSTGTFFVGCNSATVARTGDGWMSLRWTVAFTDVKSISIVFDEGQDPSGGPDQFGAAVLDNIDVNGTLVGHG